jgi:hypothetical protein
MCRSNTRCSGVSGIACPFVGRGAAALRRYARISVTLDAGDVVMRGLFRAAIAVPTVEMEFESWCEHDNERRCSRPMCEMKPNYRARIDAR